MSNCIHCNVEVHPKRVEILQRNKQPITCLEHSETQKVVGFQVNEGKSERYMQINSPEQGKVLQKMERKTGGATGGPSINGGNVVYKPTKK